MKWSVFVLILATACGPGNRQSPGDDDGSGGGGDGGGGGSGSANGSGSDGCSDDAKLIYTVDMNNKLSKFDPSTKTFTMLGTLNCPAGLGASPFSMAVDRTAQAYVLYDDNSIYKVDTTMASLPCSKTSWTSQHNLEEFGMGYSTDTMGGTTDTLFIAGGPDLSGTGEPTTATLATVSTTFTATTTGTVNGWPELTGNSNAELWGWFPDQTAPKVEQINKTTGAALVTYPESSLAGTPTAWAFGYYGGDYWVFLEKDSETNSTVYEVAGPTNTMHTPGSIVGSTPATGLTIVGAGVSTCAPTVIL